MFKIIYINLDRSTERKKNIENEIRYHFPKYEIEREAAVDGQKLKSDDLKQIVDSRSFYYLKNNNHRRLLNEDINNTGHIACSLSHINCWKKLINDLKYDYYLICEDDITFYPDPKLKIKNYLSIYPNIDFLSFIYINNRANTDKDNFGNFKINHPFYGTQCYLISKQAAKIFVENVFPFTCQIDAYIGYASNFNNLKSILVSEVVGQEVGFSTDIGHESDTNCVLCNLPYEFEIEINNSKNYDNYFEGDFQSKNENPKNIIITSQDSKVNLYINFIYFFMIIIIFLLCFIIYVYARKN
jgi:GR25 family glycosyltransferase involved in LPS biosynthesis